MTETLEKILDAKRKVEEMRARRSAPTPSYRDDPKEYFRLASLRHRAKDPERARAYDREYYRTHREKMLEKNRRSRLKRKEER